MISAVLFDFDGVLGDTPRAHVAAWRSILGEMKITFEDEEVFLNEGRPAGEIATRICAKAGVSLSSAQLAELVKRKNALFRSKGARATPGSEKMVREIKRKGLKVGLVTGTVRENLVAVLGAAFLSLFDVVVTETEVRRGKPHPDPYLHAARTLQLAARECLVVENAPSGIAAAKAAGMPCVALTTTLPRASLNGADYFYTSLEELRTQLDGKILLDIKRANL